MNYRTFSGFLKRNPKIRLFLEQNTRMLPYLAYLAGGGESDYLVYQDFDCRNWEYQTCLHECKSVDDCPDISDISTKDRVLISLLQQNVIYCPFRNTDIIFYIDIAMKMNLIWKEFFNKMVKNQSQWQFLPYVAYCSYHRYSPARILNRKWFDEHYELLNQYMVQLKLSGEIQSGLPYPVRRHAIISWINSHLDLPKPQVASLYDAWDLVNDTQYPRI
jgi:hypothetical protein